MALPPPRTAEIYYADTWHPVSVREADAVSITRGLSGAGTRAEPTTGAMTLGNRHGELSVYDPASQVYGKVGRNTPLRFAVDAGGPRAVLPGDTTAALTTPDHPALGGNGDLDLRFELASDDYSLLQDIAERWLGTGNQRSWAVIMLGDRQLQLRWSPDGTNTALGAATSSVRFPAYPGQRLAVRVTLDVNNGAGGWTARFYWARSLASPIWNLLDTVSGSGVTSVYDGTAGIRFGTATGFVSPGVKGRLYGMQLRNGIGGPAVVDLDIERDAEMGDTSFTDSTGLVWTLSGAVTLSNRHIRLDGEVPAWPPERHISGNDSVVKVAPAGILRRLGTGRKPLRSALHRAILAAGPVECWPLTDGPEAASGAPLIGTNFLLDQGGPNTKLSWGKGKLADWIEPVLQADTGGASRLEARCPASAAAATGWAVDWVRAGAGTDPGPELFHFVDSGKEGNQWVWTVEVDPVNTQIRVSVSNADTGDGNEINDVPAADIFDGRPHHLRLRVANSGPSALFWILYIDGVERGSGTWIVPTASLAYIACIFIMNLVNGAPPVSTGYLTYWAGSPPPAEDMTRAMLGHSAEAAGDRILRVSAEQGVPASCDGDPAVSEALGAQEMDGYLDILETASKADLGLLLDRRDARSLLYRPRASLYTQAPLVTLDYSAGAISRLRPQDADRLVRNEVTATRAGGSEHTATQTDGPMSVQDPPDGVGRYDEGTTLSLATDDQTVGQAWWRLHLGTVEGLRYPQVTVDLANPHVAPLLAKILAADVGDLLRLTHLPPEYGPDDVDLLIRGYTEEIGPERWTITFVCDPGRPWAIGIADDPVYGRADTDGSHLGVAVDADDTTMVLVSTGGPEWIRTATHGPEFPFDVTVGGERVRVTGIRGVVEDTFARSVSSGWGTADSGQPWAVLQGPAADFSVASGVGRQAHPVAGTFHAVTASCPTADVDLTTTVTVSALPNADFAYVFLMARVVSTGTFYMARIRISSAGAMQLTVRKRVSNSETELGSYTVPGTYTAAAQYRLRFSVQGTSLKARAWLVGSLEPDTWQVTATDSEITVIDDVGIRTLLGGPVTNLPITFSFDNIVSLPQQATVIRSINGVVKPQAAGEPVSLTHPMIVAL